MTRQKKEILKRIEQMDNWIAADIELGCGFYNPDAYADMYEKMDKLYEQLAHLRHYNSAEEMSLDERGLGPKKDEDFTMNI